MLPAEIVLALSKYSLTLRRDADADLLTYMLLVV